MFYRYRHKTSASRGKWEYGEFLFKPRKTFTKEHMLRELSRDLSEEAGWSYSDHYRGCEVEEIDKPPDRWLVDEIIEAQERIVRDKARIKRYQAVLDKMSPPSE